MAWCAEFSLIEPLFLGFLDRNGPTFFTGGPVQALAWCPTGLQENTEQILALSCLETPPPKNENVQPAKQNIIQIWSVGKLQNSQTPTEVPVMRICFYHPWGVVRELLWCPTGCWDPQNGVYGLLAVATSEAGIRILSVPALESNGIMVQAADHIHLKEYPGASFDPCLTISWYTGDNCSFIAGGFENGYACVWNLNDMSNDGEPDHDCRYPYVRFQAHWGPCSIIELLLPRGPIPRYLFTGGLVDKFLRYWDLERGTQAFMGEMSRGGGRPTCSTWMSNWPNVIVGFEEPGISACTISPRNFSQPSAVLPQNSATLSIDKSDWLNGLVQGTLVGEVTMVFVNQMLYGMGTDKHHKDNRGLLSKTLMTATDVFLPGPKREVEDLDFEELCEQGFFFCDVDINVEKLWPNDSKVGQSKEFMESDFPGDYSIRSIRQIKWSPNYQSFAWIAVGYHLGFVRLIKVRCDKINKLAAKEVEIAMSG